ncbi:MAG: peptidylprolyl isomerase, partial [Moorea sp. SIO3I6]|nr:peptidylprolyl isomerase [Moorena sp. SIO3I6]
EIIKPELNQELRTQIMSELFEEWLESKMMMEQVTVTFDKEKVTV